VWRRAMSTAAGAGTWAKAAGRRSGGTGSGSVSVSRSTTGAVSVGRSKFSEPTITGSTATKETPEAVARREAAQLRRVAIESLELAMETKNLDVIREAIQANGSDAADTDALFRAECMKKELLKQAKLASKQQEQQQQAIAAAQAPVSDTASAVAALERAMESCDIATLKAAIAEHAELASETDELEHASMLLDRLVEKRKDEKKKRLKDAPPSAKQPSAKEQEALPEVAAPAAPPPAALAPHAEPAHVLPPASTPPLPPTLTAPIPTASILPPPPGLPLGILVPPPGIRQGIRPLPAGVVDGVVGSVPPGIVPLPPGLVVPPVGAAKPAPATTAPEPRSRRSGGALAQHSAHQSSADFPSNTLGTGKGKGRGASAKTANNGGRGGHGGAAPGATTSSQERDWAALRGAN